MEVKFYAPVLYSNRRHKQTRVSNVHLDYPMYKIIMLLLNSFENTIWQRLRIDSADGCIRLSLRVPIHGHVWQFVQQSLHHHCKHSRVVETILGTREASVQLGFRKHTSMHKLFKKKQGTIVICKAIVREEYLSKLVNGLSTQTRKKENNLTGARPRAKVGFNVVGNVCPLPWWRFCGSSNAP